MTKQSDAWDALFVARSAKRRAAEESYAIHWKIEDQKRAARRRLFGMWDRNGNRVCLCHGMDRCANRLCRTIERWNEESRSVPRSKYFGSFYPLWTIIHYLKDMASGKGESAKRFGKRFAHRRAIK
jgi:hypothetical protein